MDLAKSAIALEFGDALLARDYAKSGLKVLKNHPEGLTQLGRALSKGQNHATGIRRMESAAMLSPLNGARHVFIAEATLDSGNQEAFQAALNRARAILREHESIECLEIKRRLPPMRWKKLKDSWIATLF